MPPKRKSAVLEPVIDLTADEPEPEEQNAFTAFMEPAAKKARVSDVGEGSSSGAKKGKAKTAPAAPKDWREIVLEGEDEGEVPIFDDCNEVRRKIRALQKEPGFKITRWLKEIGNINNNSFQRFMKASGPTGGAGNGTYYAAYVYFEKVRIAQGKKKTPKRERNEAEHGYGMPREERKHMWVFCGHK
ncbi:hypothetical protein L227DRAFT_608975 [Lentinus tigrinus ALCF2SS1-6]|uniref:DUF7726 domain-containing protein n=1 Tax=Lentinus tigrinus ALCF2SS1-6 TaxID=1328759 RepID=A0A5C2SNN1_9APHY|nr:hypothetical protein L227DRAFT_608975 [Lentinus tigrinus ALCF2SS1-6]